MAHIILQILAVLGIILLCLLGLVILLLLLMLFVPVRYKLKGSRTEDDMQADIRVTWLLHVLSVVFSYPKPGVITVRVFGIKLYPRKTKPPKETKLPANAEKEQTVQAETAPKTDSTLETDKKTDTEKTDTKETDTEETGQAEKNSSPQQSKAPQKEKQGFFHKMRYTFQSVYDKIKRLIENYEYYRDILLAKENQLLYGRCKKRLFRVLKSICPKTIQGNLLMGTGEPDTTGYVLAIYGMLLPILGNHIHIEPDFDRAVLTGRLFVKGRITLFVLLWNAAGIFFDKQLHALIKGLKREEP